MLEHVAESDQIEPFANHARPIALIQIDRQHTSAEFAGLFRSLRVDLNPCYMGTARRKLFGDESRRAPAFQDAAVLSGLLDKNVVPAETVAIGWDVIATALQGGLVHQRFIRGNINNCNI